ncbi:MAG: hypothetical protein JNM41_09200 [Flavipsychrobacter sp.]|nr:hypothetical protein [Flavipsychrobacter sp.]
MSIYYRDNEEIFGAYPKVYDQQISDLLSIGPFSSACLIGEKETRCFQFKNISADTIRFFKKVLAEQNEDEPLCMIVKDSIFSIDSKLTHVGGCALIFNSQIQAGIELDYKTGQHQYVRTKYHDTTVGKLYKILADNGVKKLNNTKEDRGGIKKIGLAEMSILNLNVDNNSLCFRLFAVAKDTVIKETDTNINVYFIPKTFVGRNSALSRDALNIENYPSFTFIDTIHDESSVLTPSITNYEANGNHLFVPYLNYERCKKQTTNGREIMLPTSMSIVKMSFFNNGKARKEAIYYLDEVDESTPYYSGTFFYRISDEGTPVMVNQTKRVIEIAHHNSIISFDNFIFGVNDSIKLIYDISMTKDELRIVALTKDSIAVKIVYGLSDKRRSIERISSELFHHAMRIYKDRIYAYRKDEISNQIMFERLTF